MKSLNRCLILGALAAGAASLSAADAPAAGLAAAAAHLAPSVVRVEYHLQSDKGDPPQGSGLLEKCPNCGRYHVDGAAEMLEEERPLEVAGWVLSGTQVVSTEVQIHPRFIKQITVRYQDQVVPAEIGARAAQYPAVRLDLKGPLPGIKPLRFEPASGPYRFVTAASANGEWTITVQPWLGALVTREKSPAFLALPTAGLMVSAAGAPVGFSAPGELPLDDSWQGSPQTWAWTEAERLTQKLAEVEQAAGAGLLRVALSFRSPKKSASRPAYRYDSEEDGQEGKGTERNAVGVLLPDHRLLVLASLKPKTTARMQTITVYPPQGSPVTAKFTASLRDYGCFLATLEQPLTGPVKLRPAEILSYRQQRLYLALVKAQGEKRTAYFQSGRFAAFAVGFKQRVYPTFGEGGPAPFVFDADGSLIALPLAKREKLSTETRYASGEEGVLTPVKYLTDALADLPGNSDLANVPLTEAEENRIAWLGLELQALNQELARVNGVSDQTRDGETGGLVSYVYPDSPAAQAGVEAGWVLLRVRVATQPNPLEIKVEDDRQLQAGFPWDRLGELPEQYFDQVPLPWPPVENSFTRLLTDLGLGTPFTAEFFTGGKLVAKPFTVQAGPPHYESAERFKSEALGLTVRNLTYEVRRVLQKLADDPGVVVAKIETGSKASIAGMKPYELITHVNDQPVADVQAFQKLTAAGGELRLSVKRMNKGRIATVRLDPPGPGKSK